MFHKSLACFAVALCLTVGTEVASATSPCPSPLAQVAVTQIDNLATAYENWTYVVCPIYSHVVDYYYCYGLNPYLAHYYEQLYVGVVCQLAEFYSHSVCSTADLYLSLVYSNCDRCAIYEAKSCALDRIYWAKKHCICEILGDCCYENDVE